MISSLNQKKEKQQKQKFNKKNPKKNTKFSSYLSLPGNDPDTPYLQINSLTIRPLMHV